MVVAALARTRRLTDSFLVGGDPGQCGEPDGSEERLANHGCTVTAGRPVTSRRFARAYVDP